MSDRNPTADVHDSSQEAATSPATSFKLWTRSLAKPQHPKLEAVNPASLTDASVMWRLRDRKPAVNKGFVKFNTKADETTAVQSAFSMCLLWDLVTMAMFMKAWHLQRVAAFLPFPVPLSLLLLVLMVLVKAEGKGLLYDLMRQPR